MTNNPLTPYEAAARIYCQRIGHDPDEQIPAPHPLGIAIEHYRSAWELAAEKLIDLSHMLGAMREAASAPVVVQGVQ